MGNENTTQEIATGREKGMRHRHLMAATVLALGLLSIAMLAATHYISERGYENFALTNALMDLQVGVATSYLRLEEAFRGDQPVDMDKAWVDLNRAITLSEAILKGGDLEHGLILSPLSDTQLRTQAQEILSMLSEYKMIMQQRYENPEHQGSRSLLDQRSDEVFTRLLQKTEDLETTLERKQVAGQAYSRRLFSGILLAWSCVVVGAITGLWSRERRRKVAETALLKVNTDLASQTEELRKHREHLVELVEERALGLRTANRELQKEVAERKEAEEALRKSEERYRMLVETMNEGLMVLGDAGVLTYVNDRFCAMLGYSRDELLGHRSIDFIAEGDRKIVSDKLLGVYQFDNNRYEVTFQTKDGESVFTLVSPKGVSDRAGNLGGCFAVVTDITERLTLQARSMRTAHLASLGELGAGVAHEINNPINGVINYAQILCNKSQGDSQERDLANRILKEGRRIADIVRGLLLFARGGKREKAPVHLREILSDSLGLTGSQLRKEGINIQSTVPDDLPHVLADPQEIQQVFMNIISNARHALNQKYPGRHDEKRLQIHAEHVAANGDGPYVRITFHDRGVGIPAGIIDKIREPFFSTKPRGRGTGLGLSLSDGIISEHGGKLAIESVEGEFTNVVIDLPASPHYSRKRLANNAGLMETLNALGSHNGSDEDRGS